jgi:Leucine-rich repeat (LRR) protein
MDRDQSYQAAEKKIDEARRSGTQVLDLSTMNLTELPSSIGQLDQLRVLEVSNNQLTVLPDSLGLLSRLFSLSASHNKLTALPESLGQLIELQHLYLNENELTCLPETLGNLTKLEKLYLYGNQLAALPDSLSKLVCLQDLSLFTNRFASLPDSLSRLDNLQDLGFGHNQLEALPEWLGELTKLTDLSMWGNPVKTLPDSMANLTQLKKLNLPALLSPPDWLSKLAKLRDLGVFAQNMASLEWLGDLTGLQGLLIYHWGHAALPRTLSNLKDLQRLDLVDCQLTALPEWISELTQLSQLGLSNNGLRALPEWLGYLAGLQRIALDGNPLNPELAAAHTEGIDAVKRYLRTKAGPQVALNEAKLILVGEGEVGKSCLLGALRGDPWEEGKPSTHGIEIKPVMITNPGTGMEMTLNGWDFGGQRVYRPTHQLFFSAPAVYLVVWKPREGTQQGLVREWIQLVKHREPDAKILVVATHGGPGHRQPDIDRQELWDLFTRDTVIDFFLVDSKPNENGTRPGVAELRNAIAMVAAGLPEMGREVPARWQEATEALRKTGAAYLPLEQVLDICRDRKLDEDEAKLFLAISHRLGHLIYYGHDPLLRDIVILKPDWLSTAMSLVLDDKKTRDAHGLISFAHLSKLWNDPSQPQDLRYPSALHVIFLRLMERFDLSYRVAESRDNVETIGTSLIAQLVPDVRPDLSPQWAPNKGKGDEQQSQICRVVDANTGQTAPAEGLFYQLIVRLHKYSLGRKDYDQSVHWQRGLVLDDDYNGRALLENVGNDLRITVRAPYPESFLSVLTHEVKWLVENFWAGLRCDVMVPCIEPCGKSSPGVGLFEVQKLITFKRQGMRLFPCIVSGCSQAQDIDHLLRNAPAQRAVPEELAASLAGLKGELAAVRPLLLAQHENVLGRFSQLDIGVQRVLSKVDDAFIGLMQALLDEAKEGPRLFSFRPIEPGFFDRPKWMSEKFELTLWCERSRLPLPSLNGKDNKSGVYELTLPREWFLKAAPFFKVLTATLSLALPVASAATKLVLDETAYKGIEKQLEMGQKSIEATLKGGELAGAWLGEKDAPDMEGGDATRAQGAVLRQLHAWLKEKDPGFGGLVRVQNKRQEFLWVHKKFEGEY